MVVKALSIIKRTLKCIVKGSCKLERRIQWNYIYLHDILSSKGNYSKYKMNCQRMHAEITMNTHDIVWMLNLMGAYFGSHHQWTKLPSLQF